MTLPNGTRTTYSYDPASQVTQILHQIVSSTTQINQAAYAYNPVGNRTSLTDRRGSQAFGYDTLDRLTSASHPLLATPQAFAYDAVGNRTTGGSVVNAGNQLTADANFVYQYDDNGNLTKKTLLATGQYTQYTYDTENRLTKVEEFAAGNPTPAFTSTYRYDGLGRRIEKVAKGQTKRYVYDGEDILLEYDGANVLQARYTHGPGIDEPIAVTKGGSTFFYHQDGLGTVTDLTDSTGATAKSYSYDAYGTIMDQTGTVDQPYTYTGRELDSETGLYYYRARYYDPSTGRFLQEDPIGLSGGINFYAAFKGNPLLYTDPSGMFNSVDALNHYMGGSGTSVSIPFSDVDTSGVSHTDFSGVATTLRSVIGQGVCKAGTYNIDSVKRFDTTGDAENLLGNIGLNLKGALSVNCDCSWCFKGTLSALPDPYDFNPSTHRTWWNELKTTIGRQIPGQPYQININGTKPISQCAG